MAKVANETASSLIQQIVHEYIGTKSWFYQTQVDPYLPEMAAYFLNEIAKHGISLSTADPAKKAAKDAKSSS